MVSFYKTNARWLLGGFLLTFFSGFGQTFFISIWGSEIRGEFGLSHGEFGFIYMLATLASALVLPFVGRLVDVVSVAVCSAIVIVMLAVASATISFVQSVPLLGLSIFLLRLFGQGMMTHTSITAMGRWYSTNRGKAVSFASIRHQASEGLAPLTFVAIAALVGWRQSWVVAALMLLLIALPLSFLLMQVERIPRSDQPAEPLPTNSKIDWTRAQMLRDPLFWLTALGMFSPSFIGTSIFFHQDYLIEINNWPPELYYRSFALMAVTTLLVSLLTGFAVDRWSAMQILPFFMVPLGAACLVLGLMSSTIAIIYFMILQGISYGISSTLFGSLWPEVYGTRNLGSLRSVTVSMMVFMSAAGPGLTGTLIDRGIPFSEQLIVMGAYCLLTVIALTIASRGYQLRRSLV